MHGQDPVSFADVKDEIFDMVKPNDPLHIALQVYQTFYYVHKLLAMANL